MSRSAGERGDRAAAGEPEHRDDEASGREVDGPLRGDTAVGTRAPSQDGTFGADWLRSREPVDHRSRAEGLTADLVDAWGRRGWSRIVDLGSGTGSNVRYLAPRLPGSQRWTLVDHDAGLLARAVVPPEAGTPRVVRGDLEREGLRAIADADLVLGAALLDLVSEGWLRAAAVACRGAGAGALFTTIYDGTIRWEGDGPADAERSEADERVREAVNAHQVRDKGLGTALGPGAGDAALRLFGAAGYRARSRPSPWVLGPADRPLVLALMDGWARAAREQEPDAAAVVDMWMEHRTRWVSNGEFRLTIGHVDVLALPEGSPADVVAPLP